VLSERATYRRGVNRGTTKTAGALLALLLVIMLEGCGGVTDASPAPSVAATTAASVALTTRITVSLGIYSGRPDPSWDLTEAQVAQVGSAIEALPVTSGTPPQGGLGYHGFTLALQRSGEADETTVAYRGTVAPLGVGQRTYRIDDARAVERLLLDFGRPALTPTEIAVVEADLLAAP
jgi:hypothetical protein